MATGLGKLTELHIESTGATALIGGRITCPPNLRPAPGQYLAACGPGLIEPLTTALFPAGLEGEELILAPSLPTHWTTGLPLALRGPLGNGFQLPATARRVALAGLEPSPARLLPLAALALQQQASVALYTGSVPAGLPPEIEVMPIDQLPEAPAWADFLAVDISLPELPHLRQALGLKLYAYPACPVQVLIATTLPCLGLAECGVCSIPTREGWRLACSDGPVFDFHSLEV